MSMNTKYKDVKGIFVMFIIAIVMFSLNSVFVSALSGACPDGCGCFDSESCILYDEDPDNPGTNVCLPDEADDCDYNHVCGHMGYGPPSGVIYGCRCAGTDTSCGEPGHCRSCIGLGICEGLNSYDSDSECVCPDSDGDGYGSPGGSLCSNGPETDCDDSDPDSYPDAIEIYDDNIDNDCDDLIDEISITTSYSGNATHGILDATNENKITTRSIHDRFGNMVKIIEAKDTVDEAIATYEYDILGNLVKITDPENHVTRNQYNTLSQLIREEHPDTGVTQLEYDINGNLEKTTDALGRVIKRDYDALNRIKYIDYDDDRELEVQYLHDNECGNANTINSWGKVCKIIDLSGTIEFVYDDRGRITSETKTIDDVSYVIEYEYDNAGNVVSITYPSSKKVIYNYNELQQLESVKLDDETIIADYDYNPTGTIDQVSFGNSITSTYEYTIRDRLESIDSGSSVFQKSYAYDPVGNMKYMYDDPNKVSQIAEFNYDNLNRLVDVDSDILEDKSYSYDKVGNRKSLTKADLTRTYEYDYEQSNTDSVKLKKIVTSPKEVSLAVNSITGGATSAIGKGDGSSEINMEYDAVGNLIDDGTYKYFYDHENRLVKVTSRDDVVIEEYVYDYLGNRVKKTNGENTIIYLYDIGSSLIEEITVGPYCGDSIVNANEACDNGSNNGTPCTAGYGSTCTYCNADCSSEITVTGPYCGDNILNGNEQCDGNDELNGKSCTDYVEDSPYIGGTLSCDSNCEFDVSACDYSPNGSFDSASCTSFSGTAIDDDSPGTEIIVDFWLEFLDASGNDPTQADNVYLGGVTTFEHDFNFDPTTSANYDNLSVGQNVGVSAWGINVDSNGEREDTGHKRLGILPVNCGCGDNTLNGNEACDDGNTNNGDGCNSSCETEAGYACTGDSCVLITDSIYSNGNEACQSVNIPCDSIEVSCHNIIARTPSWSQSSASCSATSFSSDCAYRAICLSGGEDIIDDDTEFENALIELEESLSVIVGGKGD